MAVIKPFCCIHPAKGMEEKIAALPYDVYSSMEARKAVSGNPLSFLNIDRPETMFPEGQDMYAKEVYEAANQRLWKMKEDGLYVKEEQAVYYVYELEMLGRKQTGIVAVASIDNYQNQVIKRHENTREDKEMDRIHHVDICNAQTGPIFLTYRAKENINRLVEEIKQGPKEFSFISEDGISHTGWKVAQRELLESLEKAFSEVESIYIADGHHRAASAVKVGLKRRMEHPNYNGTEEFNYFLSVLFPDEQLLIMDYNRLVKDLHGLSEESFLQKVQEKFLIERVDDTWKPTEKGQIWMYLHEKSYALFMKKEYQKDDPVEGLDVAYLQRELLEPVLGILDPRTDKRIAFVGGIRGREELKQRTRQDMEVAFAMYPTSIQELFEVSDAGCLMPPKSTWFEPKLRSGLFIHEIEK